MFGLVGFDSELFESSNAQENVGPHVLVDADCSHGLRFEVTGVIT